MEYFKPINNLPILDLKTELFNLIQNKIIVWPDQNQVCINTLPDHPDDYLIGCGSLYYNWTEKKIIKNQDGTTEVYAPKFQNPKKESDFTVLCNAFKKTLFEEVYNELRKKYKIGRIRLMKMKPKTCLSWHIDLCARVHFPIKTQDGCIMVIENEVMHMPADTWWYTNTHNKHTAVNASNQDRIHLVCSVTG